MAVVRILRTPTFEAWLARSDAWWSARSRRERMMLSVLAVLLGGIVLIYGVIKPLQAARADAIADIRTYETLNARIRAAGTLTTARAPQRSGAPAQMLTDSAASAGVVATVEPVPGGVRATVADASYDAVLGWIADVGASTPLRIVRVEIRRGNAPGRVSAVVDCNG